MDGRDFLKVAKSLIAGSSEAEYRSAVSRAYYGAYNFARQLLDDWSFEVSVGSSGHGEVRNMFSNCGVQDIEVAANKLNDLHGRRIDADYLRKDDIGKQNNAKLYVGIAVDIVKTLEKCLVDPHKTTAINGIRTYRLKIKATP